MTCKTVVFGALVAMMACGGTQKATTIPGKSELRGIAAAGLPFRVVRVDGGREISLDEMLTELSSANAVCIGETHTNPHDHWAQLELLDRLTAQNQKNDIATALGMEMFQRPFQGVLDDFAAGKIDDKALLSRSGWAQRWGYDWNLYKPILHLARERKAALLALNVSNELKVKVRESGPDKLEADDKQRVPELELDNKDHRAWWNALMAGMGGSEGHKVKKAPDDATHKGDDRHDPSKHDKKPDDKKPDDKKPDDKKPDDKKPDDKKPDDKKPEEKKPAEDPAKKAAEAKARAERMYMIQILWDETMADTAARWVRAGIKRQVVIIAGNGHCHDSAIVHRVRRRGVKKVVSIRPVIDKADGEVAALLAAPENDYLFVMEMPAGGE